MYWTRGRSLSNPSRARSIRGVSVRAGAVVLTKSRRCSCETSSSSPKSASRHLWAPSGGCRAPFGRTLWASHNAISTAISTFPIGPLGPVPPNAPLTCRQIRPVLVTRRPNCAVARTHPFASAGGGSTFENKVACLLTVDLLCTRLSHLGGLVVSVARQTGPDGFDDLTVALEVVDGTIALVHIQCRHRQRLTGTDKKFKVLLAQAWAAVAADLSGGCPPRPVSTGTAITTEVLSSSTRSPAVGPSPPRLLLRRCGYFAGWRWSQRLDVGLGPAIQPGWLSGTNRADPRRRPPPGTETRRTSRRGGTTERVGPGGRTPGQFGR